MVGQVWMELVELIRFFFSDFFVAVGFVYSRCRSTVTDGCVDRYTSHVIFLMQFTPHNWCASHCIGSSVCMRASPHIHAIHDERLIVCSLLLLRSVFLRVSLRRLLLLFHTLLSLWLALLLQRRQRRGVKPLRLRTMRSIAPWRYTIHTHLFTGWRAHGRLWSQRVVLCSVVMDFSWGDIKKCSRLWIWCSVQESIPCFLHLRASQCNLELFTTRLSGNLKFGVWLFFRRLISVRFFQMRCANVTLKNPTWGWCCTLKNAHDSFNSAMMGTAFVGNTSVVLKRCSSKLAGMPCPCFHCSGRRSLGAEFKFDLFREFVVLPCALWIVFFFFFRLALSPLARASIHPSSSCRQSSHLALTCFFVLPSCISMDAWTSQFPHSFGTHVCHCRFVGPERLLRCPVWKHLHSVWCPLCHGLSVTVHQDDAFGVVWKLGSLVLCTVLLLFASCSDRVPRTSLHSNVHARSGPQISFTAHTLEVAREARKKSTYPELVGHRARAPGEPTSFLNMYTWDALKDSVKYAKMLLTGRTEKPPFSENLRISSWSYDMEGHARKCVNDIVSWQTRRLNNSTKYILHASMTITSKRKNTNLLENFQKYLLKMSRNACTWYVFDDLIFFGQWINSHDRSRNGPKLVTKDWIVWYLTSITHVNINSIVMWVILQNNAGRDFFKTPILQEIFRTQNLLRVEHCAFLEVIHLFQ